MGTTRSGSKQRSVPVAAIVPVFPLHSAHTGTTEEKLLQYSTYSIV